MLSLSGHSDCAAKRYVAAEQRRSTQIERCLVVRSIPKAAQRLMVVRSILKDTGAQRRRATEWPFAAQRQRVRAAPCREAAHCRVGFSSSNSRSSPFLLLLLLLKSI